MIEGVASLSSVEFNDQIADPAVFCGGGSVAALTAAGAGALTLLVMRLNERRRSNAERRPEIQLGIERVTGLIDGFYRAADSDIAILDTLLGAQRSLKSGGERRSYLDALAAAAGSPIALSDGIAALIEEIAVQLPIATRFTISDLGAAATLAQGACRAALLTAEVNLAILRDAPDSDPSTVQALEQRRASVYTTVLAAADEVEAITRDAIHQRHSQRGQSS